MSKIRDNRMRRKKFWFDKNWSGCTLCYLAGLSWVCIDGIGLGWRFLIALVIFIAGERIAKGN